MKRTILLCLVLVALVSACGGATSLTGTTWTVTALSGVSVDPTVPMTGVFGSDGKLTGTGGCNNYSAAYTASGKNLTIESPVSSTMACNEATDQQESEYFYLLENSSTYEIKGNALTIKDSTGQTILEYTSAS
ncbi:MAG: META domain-containing protein [Anaerolineae bacterium]|nr:META domain-containing protein [Anaerolineae bacterium]MCB0201088.1 META domain-containing protein [Anaerolineae bacterium]MCB0203691.1 META domain-containing protein [Anaerolineae bacterium]